MDRSMMHKFAENQLPDKFVWLLEAVPHRPPFRFIDEILELDEFHILGSYRYRETEFFYRGHFPGHPITPGVILLETMVQIGGLAFGIYLGRRGNSLMLPGLPILTSIEHAEFFLTTLPNGRVFVRGKKMYFRNHHLKVEAKMTSETGQTICSVVLSGIVGEKEISAIPRERTLP